MKLWITVRHEMIRFSLKNSPSVTSSSSNKSTLLGMGLISEYCKVEIRTAFVSIFTKSFNKKESEHGTEDVYNAQSYRVTAAFLTLMSKYWIYSFLIVSHVTFRICNAILKLLLFCCCCCCCLQILSHVSPFQRACSARSIVSHIFFCGLYCYSPNLIIFQTCMNLTFFDFFYFWLKLMTPEL